MTSTKIEKLLVQLLKIDSFSGHEAEIGAWLFSSLKQAGFSVERQAVGRGRFNVIGRKGNGGLWLVAHMDTVGGKVPVRVTSERIYGRGAIDNKGNIVGAIAAAADMADVKLLFTVGEEDDCTGAKRAVKKVGNERAIIMEPTKFKVFSGQRGVIDFIVSVKGRAAHSSLPDAATHSATHLLLDELAVMQRLGWTSFNVGTLCGGLASNVAAPSAEARISARPKDMAERKKIMAYLRGLNSRDVAVSVVMDRAPLQSRLAFPGLQAGFFTEMSFLRRSVIFGVGDFRLAHSSDEHVLRRDLNALPGKLIKLARRLQVK